MGTATGGGNLAPAVPTSSGNIATHSNVLGAIEQSSKNDLLVASLAYLKYKQVKRQYIIANNLIAGDPRIAAFHTQYTPQLIGILVSSADHDVKDYEQSVYKKIIEREGTQVRESALVTSIKDIVGKRTRVGTQIWSGVIAGLILAVVPAILLILYSGDIRVVVGNLLLGRVPPMIEKGPQAGPTN